MAELFSALMALRGSTTEVFIENETHGATTTTWGDIFAQALRMRDAFQRAGIRAGTVVAVACPTSAHVVSALQALWLMRACPVFVPLTGRFGETVVPDAVQAAFRNLQPSLVIRDRPLQAACTGMAARVVDPEDILALPHQIDEQSSQPLSFALLQLTSGTTKRARFIGVPEASLMACIGAMAYGLRLRPREDRFCSWLPLYHDMGLIGMLAQAMITDSPITLLDTAIFARKPSAWHQRAAEHRATILCAPNFAYEIASALLEHSREPLDLSGIRVALNGAEMVQQATVERYAAAGRRFGLSRHATLPVYGLAEATLGVAFCRPNRPLNAITAPTDSGAPSRARFVSVGTTLPGVEVEIMSSGEAGPPVGELLVRGRSCSTFYVDGLSRTAKSTADPDGWVHTGDLATLADGELVILGRLNDVIIAGGRNFYPDAIEQFVGSLPGVRPGRVAAIPVPSEGTQIVGIALETEGDSAESRMIAAAVFNEFGTAPVVQVWQKGSIVKTTSGKVSRSGCLARWLERQDKQAEGSLKGRHGRGC